MLVTLEITNERCVTFETLNCILGFFPFSFARMLLWMWVSWFLSCFWPYSCAQKQNFSPVKNLAKTWVITPGSTYLPLTCCAATSGGFGRMTTSSGTRPLRGCSVGVLGGKLLTLVQTDFAVEGSGIMCRWHFDLGKSETALEGRVFHIRLLYFFLWNLSLLSRLFYDRFSPKENRVSGGEVGVPRVSWPAEQCPPREGRRVAGWWKDRTSTVTYSGKPTWTGRVRVRVSSSSHLGFQERGSLWRLFHVMNPPFSGLGESWHQQCGIFGRTGDGRKEKTVTQIIVLIRS